MAYQNIALFGADGQIGSRILRAFLESEEQFNSIRCFIPPGSSLDDEPKGVSTHTFDLNNLSVDGLAADWKGIECVVSALNGPALEAQPQIQDAAASAGVKRFYPSEYGFHNIYRKPNDPQGYFHLPAVGYEIQLNEDVLLHPAARQGNMSFTIIGLGDFYNQDREPVWCPWTQRPENGVSERIRGFFQAVATVCEPEKSQDQYLNFVSGTISHRKIVALMGKHLRKPARIDNICLDKTHEVIADSSRAPEDLRKNSVFPVDFWFLVKGTQG